MKWKEKQAKWKKNDQNIWELVLPFKFSYFFFIVFDFPRCSSSFSSIFSSSRVLIGWEDWNLRNPIHLPQILSFFSHDSSEKENEMKKNWKRKKIINLCRKRLIFWIFPHFQWQRLSLDKPLPRCRTSESGNRRSRSWLSAAEVPWQYFPRYPPLPLKIYPTTTRSRTGHDGKQLWHCLTRRAQSQWQRLYGWRGKLSPPRKAGQREHWTKTAQAHDRQCDQRLGRPRFTWQLYHYGIAR